jgi:two-component SAPR family response regulator
MNKEIKILIAEDESILSLYLKTLLNNLGYKNIIVVESGKNAIQYARKIDFDIIFMDIVMETKNAGIEASIKINKINPNIKIVFVTSCLKKFFDEEYNKINEIKYDYYLAKPYESSHLKLCLDELGLF